MQDSQRLFIAIELTNGFHQWLAAARAALEPALPPGSVRWVDGKGIHLTLKFLGETPARRIGEIRAAMDRTAAGAVPFGITLAGLGCFPNLYRPRVVWAGLQPEPRLASLQAALDGALARSGFAREERAFSPHLTLGRVRDEAAEGVRAKIGAAVAAAKPGDPLSMEVTGLALFRSVLKPGGAEYTALYTAEINKS